MVTPHAEHEIEEVRDYFELEAGEDVLHLEKVASDRVFGTKYDVWDVHTTTERWWVVTSPMNLYRQADFPSLDYILSFHIGLSARVLARKAAESPVSDEEQNRLAAAWRRWEQSVSALNAGEEAEDFQAVGMRCRECLLEFVRAVADQKMVPKGSDAPKGADFTAWAQMIAETVASGSSATKLRGYLKTVANSAWQYVNWLTHARTAARPDAEIAVEIAQHLISLYGSALIRYERGTPDRCPVCGSYQIRRHYSPDAEEDPYVSTCSRCGWNEELPQTEPE